MRISLSLLGMMYPIKRYLLDFFVTVKLLAYNSKPCHATLQLLQHGVSSGSGKTNEPMSVVPLIGLISLQIDEMNIYGNTALHIACYNGQDSVANELIDYGANVNQPNNSGFTPLHFAAASTHGALCLELLVNNGADVNIQVK